MSQSHKVVLRVGKFQHWPNLDHAYVHVHPSQLNPIILIPSPLNPQSQSSNPKDSSVFTHSPHRENAGKHKEPQEGSTEARALPCYSQAPSWWYSLCSSQAPSGFIFYFFLKSFDPSDTFYVFADFLSLIQRFFFFS